MDVVNTACRLLRQVLIARAPYDTGNLAMNSIRIVGNKVVVGGEIAPYAPYTNEPWRKGKNPNEGWVQRTIQEALPLIQRVLSGHATDKEVMDARAKYQGFIEERKQLMIARKLAEKEKIK